MADRATSAAGHPSPLALLLRLHWISSWRRLKAVRAQSRLLTGVIFAFLLGYLVLAYGLFFLGLRFIIVHFPGLGMALMERLLYLLFVFLFALLLISNLVISYSNLFRNRETHFLLTLPLSSATVFQWKLLESALLASWAFLFLAAPLLAAYGVTRGVAWHFYAATVLQVGVFIVLPAVAGVWLAVLLARYLDRRTFQVSLLGLMAGALWGVAWWFGPVPPPPDLEEARVLEVLDKVLFRTAFSELSLLPSAWLTAGVLHWADGALSAAIFFGLVLLSYALFFGLLAMTRTGPAFYEAVSAVQSRGRVFDGWTWRRLSRSERRRGRTWPGPLERAAWWLPGLSSDVRALIVKDTRMFWRDTTQWGQSLMLFGLLAFYIFNLRHFSHQASSPFWSHLVSYLNLGACSLNLATLTTRFVYPQFSLEGRRLWIIGLAPLGLRRVVLIKFWLAACTALVVTLGLISLSCYMLNMPWERVLHFGGAVTVMSFTLTGLAVGLGVLYPNFKEEGPSRIVSGFGGTFCLVLSFLYILGSVIMLAFSSPWMTPGEATRGRAGGFVAGFLGLSAILGGLPMHAALRRLKAFEL